MTAFIKSHKTFKRINCIAVNNTSINLPKKQVIRIILSPGFGIGGFELLSPTYYLCDAEQMS